jgi:transposase
VAELRRQVAAWTSSNVELRVEVEPLTRGGKRRAAPFSTGTRVAEPKPSGRKPGSGTFCSRVPPSPEAITEPPVNVTITLNTSPACGRPLAEERVDYAYTTAIPAIPRPQVTQYPVWGCRCTVCGTQVRGQHPEGAPDQAGATAPCMGSRVKAAAPALTDSVGRPVRKVPAVLQELPGVQLTQLAITQEARWRAGDVVETA